MVDCSISILTKNEELNIGACLKGVYSQKGVGPFKVVLVDSGSTDATVQIARAFPVRIEQIPPEEFHHARTRNFAASLGEGSIIVNLSGDAIPASDTWLQQLLANFSDPTVGAVYGRQLPKPGSTPERQDTYDSIYGDQPVIKDPAHRNGMGYRFYHFSDANSAIRRSVWESIPFPEEFKIFEDLALAKRVLDAGWKIIYEPQAPVFHSHSYTAGQLFKRYFDIGYTLKQLGIWEAPGIRSSLLAAFGRLMRGQIAGKSGGGKRVRVPEALGDDFAKGAGMILGLNQHLLPLALKRHLTAHRIFDTSTPR